MGKKDESFTLGIRVIPPTRITSPMSDLEHSASLRALMHGSTVRFINFSVMLSNFARESCREKKKLFYSTVTSISVRQNLQSKSYSH